MADSLYCSLWLTAYSKPVPKIAANDITAKQKAPAHGRGCSRFKPVRLRLRLQPVRMGRSVRPECPRLEASVFVLPASATKNGEERVVLLNSAARRVVDERRGKHDEFVFSYNGLPLSRVSNSSWKKAKLRAGLPIRFHDLRHTFGHRLRAVGTPLEDRKALMGHTSDEITTHYSAAELETLQRWVERIVDAMPSTALRTGWSENVIDLRQKRGKLTGECARVE